MLQCTVEDIDGLAAALGCAGKLFPSAEHVAVIGELMAKDGATEAALRFSGLRRGDGTPAARVGQMSALFRIWQMSIVKMRQLSIFQREVFRIQGGNQVLTDTFAAQLGDRVRLDCPVTAIVRRDDFVTVHDTEHGEKKMIDAEYLVCSRPCHRGRWFKG